MDRQIRKLEIKTTVTKANVLLIKVLTLEIRLISLPLTLASSREPAEPNAGSMGVLPHPTAKTEKISGQNVARVVPNWGERGGSVGCERWGGLKGGKE